jgi:competence protein ComEA
VHEIVLTRRRVLLGGLLLVLVLLLGARFVLRAGTAAAPPVPPIVGSAEAGAAEAGPGAVSVSQLAVYVVGAVRRPGVYRLSEGMRIEDALARAGGATSKADLAAVNLAAPLADGEQVLVPSRQAGGPAAAAPASPGGAGGGAAPAGPVQLSVATVEQLDELPGIGPVTAQKIVAYRTEHGTFHSVDDLDEVPGIGPARVEQLRDLVVP